jgi:O-antigen/teichoic acid export membrane protein
MRLSALKKFSSGDVIWIGFGQISAQIALIAGVKMLTNLLPQAEYGYYALGATMAGAVSILLFGPLGQIVYRYYSICERERSLGSYYSILQRAHLVLVISLVGLASLTLLAFPDEYRHYQYGAIAGCFVGVCASIQLYFNARQLRKNTVLLQTFENVLKYGIPGFAVIAIGAEGEIGLASFVVAEVIAVLVSLRMFQRYASRRDEVPVESQENVTARFVAYGAPFIGFSLISMFYSYGDRWLLDLFRGPGEVAQYAVLYQIGFAPAALTLGVLSQLYLPKIYSLLSDVDITNEALQKALVLRKTASRLLFAAAVLAVLVAFVCGESIVRFFSAEEYASKAQMLWILAAGHFLIAYTQISSSIGFGLNKSAIYTMPKIWQLVIMLALAYTAVPKYGIDALILIFLVGSSVNVILTEFANYRLLQQKKK